MASTFTKGLNLEMPASGDQEHTWDQTLRDNWNKLDRATSQEEPIIVTGNMTLTANQLTHAVLKFTGAPAADAVITIPNTIARMFGIRNETPKTLTIHQGTGGDVVINAGGSLIITADGAGAGGSVSRLDNKSGIAASLSGRNLVINGAFGIWQRGHGGGANFTADHWWSASGGQLHTRSTALTPPFGSSIKIVADPTQNPNIRQPLELYAPGDEGLFQIGKKFTLSFYVWTETATSTVEAHLNWGDGVRVKGPLAADEMPIGKGDGAVWKKITHTFTINTKPAPTNKLLQLNIWPGLIGETSYVTGVQLEEGDEATQFEHLTFAQEWMNCERYYQKSYHVSDAIGSISSLGAEYYITPIDISSTVWIKAVALMGRMRGKPVVKIYSNVTGVEGKYNVYGAGDNNATVLERSLSDRGYILENVDGVVSAGNKLSWQWTADAEIL